MLKEDASGLKPAYLLLRYGTSRTRALPEPFLREFPERSRAACRFRSGQVSRGQLPCIDSRGFHIELLGILGVQALPAKFDGFGTDHAAEGSSAEQVIENIETDVPSGCAH
jgi:hypothetical protein